MFIKCTLRIESSFNVWHTFDPEIKYEPLKIHLARSLPNFCQISLVNGLCKDKNLCVQPIKSVPNKM